MKCGKRLKNSKGDNHKPRVQLRGSEGGGVSQMTPL